jgi:hypothetical protein
MEDGRGKMEAKEKNDSPQRHGEHRGEYFFLFREMPKKKKFNLCALCVSVVKSSFTRR